MVRHLMVTVSFPIQPKAFIAQHAFELSQLDWYSFFHFALRENIAIHDRKLSNKEFKIPAENDDQSLRSITDNIEQPCAFIPKNSSVTPNYWSHVYYCEHCLAYI